MVFHHIREWLTAHPKVLTFVFVAGLALSKGLEVTTNGGATEGISGP
jgi:hypothetical protein